jgi:hypothetical protein
VAPNEQIARANGINVGKQRPAAEAGFLLARYGTISLRSSRAEALDWVMPCYVSLQDTGWQTGSAGTKSISTILGNLDKHGTLPTDWRY